MCIPEKKTQKTHQTMRTFNYYELIFSTSAFFPVIILLIIMETI